MTLVKSYSRTGRFPIVKFKNSEHTQVLVSATFISSDVWKAKMWVGYSYSDYLQLAYGYKWVAKLSSKYCCDCAGYNDVAVVSMRLTFRAEVWHHKIWDPQLGVISEFDEYRFWHENIDLSSLKDVDVDEYWGDFYDKRIASFVGQGVEVEDEYLSLRFIDVDANNKKLLNLAVPVSIISDLLDLGVPSRFIPKVGVTVGLTEISVAVCEYFIWADEGWVADVYFRYLSGEGIVFPYGYAVTYYPSSQESPENTIA